MTFNTLFKASNFIGAWILIAIFTSSSVFSQEAATEENDLHKRPKNVIFLIGDGMGLTQVSASYYFGDGEPNFSRFPVIGLIKTSSSSHKITDSAAGATSFASGIKTYNGAVGVDEHKNSVATIVEELSSIDYRIGLISTSSITHATPAAFYAHVSSRDMHEEIARQLMNSEVDIFIGGGSMYFNKRQDGCQLLDSLKHKGYKVELDELVKKKNLDPDVKHAILLAEDGMPKMVEGRGDFLPASTRLATNYLNDDGSPFFMVVEGSQIDWGGHANDTEYLVSELIDFDKAIGEAIDFAEKDGNTLVIVTADHETGGFTLASKKVEKINGTMYDDYDQIEGRFSTGGHSATLIPVFAYGPGSELFSGVYENTEIYSKLKALLSE